MDQASARPNPGGPPTDADWDEAMEDYKAGATDGELARRLGVTPGAVWKQRDKRGVYRRDHPVRARVRLPAPAADPPPPGPDAPEGPPSPEPGLRPSPDAPRLQVPPGADLMATAAALLEHGGALAAVGRLGEAAVASRVARSLFQTCDAQGRAARALRAANEPDSAEEFDGAPPDDAPLGPPPVLRAAQQAPEGGWRTWLFLGGRGAGKTLAGAAWLAGRARESGRLALVGQSLLDVRDVMIDGPSGLRGAAAAFGPPDGSRVARPVYQPSRRRLEWPNGAVARVFSAEDPESLRGPQFAAAWADEVCAWPRPEETLATLRMGLRLGPDPRLMLSTTPRPAPWLRALLAEAGIQVTRGSAADNAAHLSPGFVDGLRALYGGTRLERQEIEGEVLEAPEGGVFRHADLLRAREAGRGERPARFERLVVAVDPPAMLGGAACGIVVAGRTSASPSPEVGRDSPRSGQGGVVWVLEDATAAGLSPGGWAARVAEAAARAALHGPVEVVAEANQGGEMVRQVLRDAGLGRPVRLVHAVLGKRARAEPVALLYEQGRMAHAPGLGPLEDQMLLLGAGPEAGRSASPDRADALVWALTELMISASCGPRIRVL